VWGRLKDLALEAHKLWELSGGPPRRLSLPSDGIHRLAVIRVVGRPFGPLPAGHRRVQQPQASRRQVQRQLKRAKAQDA
jgi:hypothetical protein